MIFAMVFCFLAEKLKAQNSSTVVFTATKNSRNTTIELQSGRTYAPNSAFPTYVNLKLNSTVSYSLQNAGAYIELPPRTELFRVSFNNQNCVFPIVCVASTNPEIMQLANGVRVSCEYTSFDSNLIRAFNSDIQWKVLAVDNVQPNIHQRKSFFRTRSRDQCHKQSFSCTCLLPIHPYR